MNHYHYTKKGTGRNSKPNIPGYSLGKKYHHVANAKTLKKILNHKLGLKNS